MTRKDKDEQRQTVTETPDATVHGHYHKLTAFKTVSVSLPP